MAPRAKQVDVQIGEAEEPEPFAFKIPGDTTTYHALMYSNMDSFTAKIALSRWDAEEQSGAEVFIEMMRMFFTEDTCTALLNYVAEGQLDFEKVDTIMRQLLEAMTGRPTKS